MNLKHDEIDAGADDAAGDRRQQEHHDRRRLDAGEDQQARIGGADRGGGVGQVDLVHHAEDQREADAEQRVGRAEQHAVGDRLHGIDEVEKVHVSDSRLLVRRGSRADLHPRGGAADRPLAGQLAARADQDAGLCSTCQLPPLAWT